MLDAMLPYLCSYYGNPHSRTHAYGWESEAAVEKARKVRTTWNNYAVSAICDWNVNYACIQQVADLIGADPREIVFTSGATESNNAAVKVCRMY